MDKKWWKESIIYQIYPRSFMDANGDGIGDLQGIITKLDYLKDLGVDVLWLSPIYESPNDDNGYDISNYKSIMPEFGTMEDFDALLRGVHERGMRLIMDLVVNHTSDEHPWFVDAKKSKDSPYRDYYIWRDAVDGDVPNNWGSRFSGSAWEWNEETAQYYLHVFTKKQVDLNWDNPQVREAVYEIMRFWLDKGIDGYRMDVINAISKDQTFPNTPLEGLYGSINGVILNGPHVHDYLQEMNEKVLSRYDLMTVGETVNVTTEDALKYANLEGTELNMIHHFQHLTLDRGPYGMWSENRAKLSDLKKVFTKWQMNLEGKAWNSLFWNNHDEARAVSRFGNDTPEYRVKSAKMLATCLYLMQGTPYLYQGEELGMTNVSFSSLEDYDDVQMWNAYHELVEDNKVMTETEFLHGVWAKGRDNCRTPMQWSGDQNAGFSEHTPWIKCNPNYTSINAASQVGDSDSVYSYYKELIRIHHENDIVTYGNYRILEEENPKLYIYVRQLENEKLLVVSNFTSESVSYKLPQEFAGAKILITNEEKVMREDGILTLSPYGAVAFHLNK